MTPAYDRVVAKVVVDEVTGCWLLLKSLDQNGHSAVRVKVDGKWTMRKAHRVTYEHHKGPVPKGLVLRHKCDRANCCNPEHLIPGTQLMNVWDMITRGRAANQYGPYTSAAEASTFSANLPLEEEAVPF